MKEEIIRFVIIIAPFFSDFTALLVIGLEYFSLKNEYKKKISKLIFYLLCTLISSSSFLFYFYFPKIFAIINPLVMFSFIMAQVFFYNFVFNLTLLKKETFSKFHYLIPALLSITLLVLSLTTPLSHQIETITNRGVVKEVSLFNLLSNAKFPIRLVFSFIYTILGFVRIIRYQKNVVNYSANYEKSSLKWVVTFLILSLALIPIPLLGTLLSREEFSGSWLTLVQIFILVFQYAYVTFHVLKKHYTVFDQLAEEKNPINKEIEQRETEILIKKQYLTKELVDNYFKENKPYLDCNLKLGDLALMLQTNRSYLSSFINNEFKMNFSRFVNSYRLKEYIELKEENPNLSNDELVERAGFGSYKNFLRYSESQEQTIGSNL